VCARIFVCACISRVYRLPLHLNLVQLDLLGTTIMSHMSKYTGIIVQRLTPVPCDDALLSFALKVVVCRVALEEFHTSHGFLIKKYKF